MLKLYPKELKEKFTSVLSETSDFEFQEGNPFFIRLSGKPYLIFLKNLSPAYFKGSPDITRIQLPYMEIFNQALPAEAALIVLGYDSENDVYVSWSPAKLRQRINTKNNVSLYARTTVQQAAVSGGFKIGSLNTGETFAAFERRALPDFFQNIEKLFPQDSAKPDLFEQKISSPEIIAEISDPAIIAQILPLLQESKILEAATACYDYYGIIYVNMRIKDWLTVAKNMYAKLIEQ
ncbi:hypothetical protein [Mucilaginibacter sp. AK015]|uniref:hypothetical protein n=1 Tax=Mucilaginibacter sp. AK015 TaxID=2723072 RepID=UPI001613A796|nr:hypothetical protein [Mucilaginibacter sp. AK015]MBB5396700.1 hypothetical protein [Mucilaginibacter sp. AK015]